MRNGLVRVCGILAATALVAGIQARSLAQFLNGPLPAGKAFILESGLLDSNGKAYVLDDPGGRGSGTQVDIWQPTSTGNQFWLLNNLGGNYTDYYTIESYANQGLCLDAQSSGVAPGTVVQVWDCDGTWAQNWAFQFAGGNPAYVIVPGNAYWMALTAASGAYNGSPLTLQSQSGSNNADWIMAAAGTSDIDGSGNWCVDNVADCTLAILGGADAVGFAAVIGQAYRLYSLSAQEQDSESLQTSADDTAANTAVSARVPSPQAVESPAGVTFYVGRRTGGEVYLVDFAISGDVTYGQVNNIWSEVAALFQADAAAIIPEAIDGIPVTIFERLPD